MECMYCEKRAVVYAVLENGVKMNVCDKHKEFAEQNGISKFIGVVD